jgi:hypothetical protein
VHYPSLLFVHLHLRVIPDITTSIVAQKDAIEECNVLQKGRKDEPLDQDCDNGNSGKANRQVYDHFVWIVTVVSDQMRASKKEEECKR